MPEGTYIAIQGATHGPYSRDQVRAWHDSGQLDAQALIWDGSAWRGAGELFATEAAAPPEPSLPEPRSAPQLQKSRVAPRDGGPAGRPQPVAVVRPQPRPQARADGPGIMALLIKLALLGGVLSGGYYGYQKYFAPPSAAVQAYQKFYTAFAKEQYGEAKTCAVGAALGAVEKRGAPMKLLGRDIAPPSIAEIAGAVEAISWRIEAEEMSADGNEVKISAVASVHRRLPTDRVIGGGRTVDYRHRVVVRKNGGAWKVAEFVETDG